MSSKNRMIPRSLLLLFSFVLCAWPVYYLPGMGTQTSPESEGGSRSSLEGSPEEIPIHPNGSEEPRFTALRNRMVDSHIAARGVQDSRVLQAMRAVPRHLFVPPKLESQAYADRPLPIGSGQTISQPFIVAMMTAVLRMQPGEKVLEIGTGSGYQAAVLAEITDRVYTIEIIEELAEQVRARFDRLGYEKITAKQGDGYYGWEEYAPFDAIIVTAAAGHIPPPLIQQLKPGGRMVIPVGGIYEVQSLMLVLKDPEGEIRTQRLLPVRFVPLTGAGHD